MPLVILALLLLAAPAFGQPTAGINWSMNQQGRNGNSIGPAVFGVNALASSHTNSTRNTRRWHPTNVTGMDYTWDFGTATVCYTKGTNHPANSPVGPMAAMFIDPASYPDDCAGSACARITLTLTADDGTESDQDTEVIQVYDPDQTGPNGWGDPGETVCLSRDADTTGCPAGATTRTNETRNWETALNAETSGGFKRILFKAGQTWPSTGQFTQNASGPGLVSTFGVGRVTVSASQGAGNMIRINGRGGWTYANHAVTGVTSTNAEPIYFAGHNDVGIEYFAMVNWDWTGAITPRFVEGLLKEGNVNSSNDDDIHEGLYFIDNGLPDPTAFQQVFMMGGRDTYIIGNGGLDGSAGQAIWRNQSGERLMMYANKIGPNGNQKSLWTARYKTSGGNDCPNEPYCNVPVRYTYAGNNHFICSGTTGPGTCIQHGNKYSGTGANITNTDLLTYQNYWAPKSGQNPPNNFSACAGNQSCSRKYDVGNVELASTSQFPDVACSAGSTPPYVHAGPDAVNTVDTPHQLTATTTCYDPPCTLAWTEVTSPGNCTFLPDASEEDPTVTCDTVQVETLQLCITDADVQQSCDSMNLDVRAVPVALPTWGLQ